MNFFRMFSGIASLARSQRGTHVSDYAGCDGSLKRSDGKSDARCLIRALSGRVLSVNVPEVQDKVAYETARDPNEVCVQCTVAAQGRTQRSTKTFLKTHPSLISVKKLLLSSIGNISSIRFTTLSNKSELRLVVRKLPQLASGDDRTRNIINLGVWEGSVNQKLRRLVATLP